MYPRLFSGPVVLSIALAAGAASASPLFPGAVARTLQLNADPPCLLCHTTHEGEKGTATKPFARRLIGDGLMPTDTATLASILNQMKEKGTDDSDGDGVGDIAEIEQGRDPNINDVTGKPPDDYPPPSYGCAVSETPRAGAKRTALFGFTLLGCLGFMRALRRRKAGREEHARAVGNGVVP